MVKNYFILSLLLLSYVTRVFSQELSVDSFYSANRQETLNTLLMDDPIVCSCLVDSVVVYHDYSIAILQVQDTASQKRFTVVAELAQFGTTDVSKMAGQVYKMRLQRIHPFKGEMNPCDITYVSIASNENGPLGRHVLCSSRCVFDHREKPTTHSKRCSNIHFFRTFLYPF